MIKRYVVHFLLTVAIGSLLFFLVDVTGVYDVFGDDVYEQLLEHANPEVYGVYDIDGSASVRVPHEIRKYQAIIDSLLTFKEYFESDQYPWATSLHIYRQIRHPLNGGLVAMQVTPGRDTLLVNLEALGRQTTDSNLSGMWYQLVHEYAHGLEKHLQQERKEFAQEFGHLSLAVSRFEEIIGQDSIPLSERAIAEKVLQQHRACYFITDYAGCGKVEEDWAETFTSLILRPQMQSFPQAAWMMQQEVIAAEVYRLHKLCEARFPGHDWGAVLRTFVVRDEPRCDYE